MTQDCLHREAQLYESLANKLRKIAKYLANSHKAQCDPGQLNAQLMTLELSAKTMDELALEYRKDAQTE